MSLLDWELGLPVTAVLGDGLTRGSPLPLVSLQIPQLVGLVEPRMHLDVRQDKFLFQLVQSVLLELIELLLPFKYFPPLLLTITDLDLLT